MAVDAALMEGADQPGFVPFFRIYQWTPGCISLGRFQNPTTGLVPGSLERWPVVRRLTGGGAILHQDELTYSLGFRLDDWPTALGRPSYETLCRFLLNTWSSLGWSAQYAKDGAPSGPLGSYSPACFAGQEKHDILVKGRKLGGNAQRRDRSWLFQHGSIPLALDWSSLESIFEPGFRPDRGSTTDLRSLGYSDSAEDLAELLKSSLQKHLAASLHPQELTEDLRSRVKFWQQTSFEQQNWTLGEPSRLRTQRVELP